MAHDLYQEILISLNRVLYDRAYKTWEPYIKNRTYFNAIKGDVYPINFQNIPIPTEIKKASLETLYKTPSNTFILGYNVDISDIHWKKEELLKKLLNLYEKRKMIFTSN